MLFNKLLVEFVGTMFFLYIIMATGNPFAIGIALTIAILIGGDISGGMFNPAVSLMMVVAGKLPVAEFLPYVGAQLLGALVAFELSKRIKI